MMPPQCRGLPALDTQESEALITSSSSSQGHPAQDSTTKTACSHFCPLYTVSSRILGLRGQNFFQSSLQSLIFPYNQACVSIKHLLKHLPLIEISQSQEVQPGRIPSDWPEFKICSSFHQILSHFISWCLTFLTQ